MRAVTLVIFMLHAVITLQLLVRLASLMDGSKLRSFRFTAVDGGGRVIPLQKDVCTTSDDCTLQVCWLYRQPDIFDVSIHPELHGGCSMNLFDYWSLRMQKDPLIPGMIFCLSLNFLFGLGMSFYPSDSSWSGRELTRHILMISGFALWMMVEASAMEAEAFVFSVIQDAVCILILIQIPIVLLLKERSRGIKNPEKENGYQALNQSAGTSPK
jgi:hypothetical protein